MFEQIDPSASDTSDQSDTSDLSDLSDSSDLEAWKNRMRADFESWLAGIGEIPPAGASEAPETDLYGLYEQLTALRAENRKGNRKAAEVFSQFGETLGRFQSDFAQLRERLNAAETPAGPPRAHCLTLVELLDRVRRLAGALAEPPRSALPAVFTRNWAAAWESLSQAVSILSSHLERLVRSSGIEPIETRGVRFDPVTMVAVAAEPSDQQPPNSVLEELLPGYRWQNSLLRPAEVKISKSIS